MACEHLADRDLTVKSIEVNYKTQDLIQQLLMRQNS